MTAGVLALQHYSPIRVGETLLLGFDFSGLVDAIVSASAVVTITRRSGTADADPSTMRVGTPQVAGLVVSQMVTGRVAGANYVLAFQVDTPDGQRFIETGILAVRAP